MTMITKSDLRRLTAIVKAAHEAQLARKPTSAQLEAVGEFVSRVTPAVVLALLEERDAMREVLCEALGLFDGDGIYPNIVPKISAVLQRNLGAKAPKNRL